MLAYDRNIFYWINSWPDAWAPFFLFFSEGNKMWPVRIGLLLLFIFLVYRPHTRLAAILAMPAWIFANLVCDVIKRAGAMPRPSGELEDLILRVERLTSFGTASAHAATMMSIAAVFLLLGHRRWGIAWVFVAIFNGLSRIYVGVHYPYQVVLGWLVGAFVGLLIVRCYHSWQAIREARRMATTPAQGTISD